jgi:membrane-bound lytic murein transglycosylase D
MQSLVVKEVMKIHTVGKGESIGKIAKRYGCTPEDIKSWNNLKTAKLKTGLKLTVYIPVKENTSAGIGIKTSRPDTTTVVKKDSQKSSSSNASFENKKFKFYTVQKGDSLWSIGQAHGVSIEQIKELNSFSNEHKIIPGQKIKIPIPG